MNGRPLKINWLNDNVSAILETWYLGTTAGDAIADVLTGAYNPSGKLPVTFPRNEGQIPIHYDMRNTGRPFEADDKYTSKYLDVPNEPLYPFGYGLSYTTFDYGPVTLSSKTIRPVDTLTVSVEVSNTGAYDGEEVVQLYIQDKVASVARPVKELRNFKKINLQVNEQKMVEFKITNEDLSFYRKDMSYGSEPGMFTIFVGGSSVDTQSAEFELAD
jgi:beta-glucosidase